MPELKDSILTKLNQAGLPSELVADVEAKLSDGLTGLPRDAACRDLLNDLLEKRRRIVVEWDDLRFLKTYNTRIGHMRTDEFLREIGTVYRQKRDEFVLRGVEIFIGRYAGDEFLIIIPDKSRKEARPYLEEIKKALMQIEKPKGAFFKPHFSRGIVDSEEIPPAKRTTSSLIDWADRRATKDGQKKLSYIKKRAQNEGNQATKKLLEKIRRYG